MNTLFVPPEGSILELIVQVRDEPELAQSSSRRRTAEQRLLEATLVDQVLFELQLGQYDGPATRQLFDDLWLYAWPVIKAFLRTNRMGEVLRRYAPHRTASISPEDMIVLAQSEEERDALALDVITHAIENFKQQAIVGRRWSAAGGAALRTWFIGTCALNFPRAYQRWSAQRANRLDRIARRYDFDAEEVAETVAANVPDPMTVAADRDDLRAMIEKAQPMTKVILGLVMKGLTQAQIASELGMSVRAVEGRLYRFRTRVLVRQQQRNLAALVPEAARGA